MKLIVKITVLLTFAIAYSCTKDADNLKYPEYKQKLVISGYLSPEEKTHYISVECNQILYVNHHEYTGYRNMTATISNGENEISLRPSFYKYNNFDLSVWDSVRTGFLFTSSELPVEEGKTYTLKVYNENELLAESSCTVPFKRDLSPKLDTTKIISPTGYSYFKANFSFTDIAGEENYYALLCEYVDYKSRNILLQPYFSNLIDPEISYFNDIGIDGKRSKIQLENIYPSKYLDSVFIKIFFLNTDKPYYDYQKSILNYVSGETPFTEASPVYSNIKGGLGIFAAYTYDSIIVRLK
jgi:hypothetical protein